MNAILPSLDAIQARADAATNGPWFLDADGDSGVYTEPRPSPTSRDVASAYEPADEAFIAAARTDVPALVAALRAVLDLHREDIFRGHLSNGCATCGGDYPCPTVRAITAHIDTTPKEKP